jgi:hypothetical protein
MPEAEARPVKPAPPPRSAKDRASQLALIFTFDSDAFRADAKVPQELCDAMLALAVAFNDCRDLLLWMEGLLDEMPPRPPKWNRLYGEHGGTTTHTFRLLAALVHEVGEVIRKNSKAFNEPLFRREVLERLRPRSLAMWRRVTSLATGKTLNKPMDLLLELLRNKSTYHYDPKELRKAYERRFPSGTADRKKKPLVSLGDNVYGTRFYFADAAALEIIEEEANARGLMPLAPKMTEALRDLSMTFALVLRAFIEGRTRDKWKAFAEDP